MILRCANSSSLLRLEKYAHFLRLIVTFMLCKSKKWVTFPMMPDQSIRTRYPVRSLGCISVGAAVLLCIGVLMPMLGVAITLWDPAEAADIADPLVTSALEGFSIPSSITTLRFLPYPLPLITSLSSLHEFLLASVPFHPPPF